MWEFTYHTTRVGGRVSIYHSAPDVEVLAGTAVGIGNETEGTVPFRPSVHVTRNGQKIRGF